MPIGRELFRNEADKTHLEERNSRLQIDEVRRQIKQMDGTLNLTGDIVRAFRGIAIGGVYQCAGQFRIWPVQITGSAHRPPDWRVVEGLVEQMCEEANGNLDWTPIQTAAYLLWRLTWIHPFGGGNGRTSRAVSYLALNVRLGYELPGELTIPDQLVTNRRAYQEALRQADDAWSDSVLDIGLIESLLARFLKNQLRSVPDLG